MKKGSSSKTIWLAVIIWTVIIFSASMQSGESSGHLSGTLTKAVLDFLSSCGLRIPFETAHFFIRKAAHFSEYAVLGLLVCIAEKRAPLLNNDTLCIFLWMVSVPLCDESIQHFVSGRYGVITDSLLDMCGFLSAWLLYLLFTKRKRS